MITIDFHTIMDLILWSKGAFEIFRNNDWDMSCLCTVGRLHCNSIIQNHGDDKNIL